MVMTILISG